MQFVVPQFIDVEDKVIGPITVRQFIVLLAGSGVLFIAYKLSDFALFILEFIFVSALTFGFAFIKVNGRPVHYLLLNIFQTFRSPKVKVWSKEISNETQRKKKGTDDEVAVRPLTPKNHVRASRLAELALIVDTGGVYQGEVDYFKPELTMGTHGGK